MNDGKEVKQIGGVCRALNMTQIDTEAQDGTVVVSGNNVFASGRSVRVNVRSASVVAGISV